MSKYQVILSNGKTVNVPNDKAQSKYEYISDYGLQAVLIRAKRTRAYKAAVERDDATIRVIVTPKGEEITQF